MLFEWHSLGNISVDESYLPLPTNTTEPYDYLHPNSISLATDGNLLLSARHTSTLYKIDRVDRHARLAARRQAHQLRARQRRGVHVAARHPRPCRGRAEPLRQRRERTGRHVPHDVALGLLLHVDEAARKVTTVRSYDNPQGACR